MADAVLSILKSILKAFPKYVVKEIRFSLGVKSHVEELRAALNCLHTKVSSLEEEPQLSDLCYRNTLVEAWDVLRDAEDILNTYETEVPMRSRNRQGRQILRAGVDLFTSCVCVKIHIVEALIQEIRPRMCRISSDVEGLINSERSSTTTEEGRSSTSTDPHLVEACDGRGDSVEEIVRDLLTKGNEQHRVVTICGMGGLGKTAVAKKVLSHPKIKRKFDCFAWACLSRECSPRDLAEGILRDLLPKWKKQNSPDQTADREIRDIFRALYDVQKAKRCLVVLDDVRDTRVWDKIGAPFQLENTRSRLLITTRNMAISRYVDPRGAVHKLRTLSPEDSLMLLKRKIGPETLNGLGMDEDTDKFVHSMLEQCGGFPGALSALCKILSDVKTGSEWEAIRRNMPFYLIKERKLFRVFSRSYNDLPQRLRQFFLYLGNFPEGAQVPIRKLIQMWTAEGFLSTMDSIEAEQILKQLVERDLIQVSQVDKSTGFIKSVCLHNLMREFCISTANQTNFSKVVNLRDEDESGADFPKVINLRDEDEFGGMVTRKIRRLSVLVDERADGDALLGQVLEDKRVLQLRTLLLFPEASLRKRRNWEELKCAFKHHKFLRILELEGFRSMEGAIPRSIGDLVHLRYLSFKNTQVERLPPSLWKLKEIETLDLRGISSPTSPILVTNPRRQMDRLRSLYLPRHFSTDNSSEKLRLDRFKNLLVLKNFSPSVCEERDLAKLPHLRKLTAVCSAEDAKRLSSFAVDRRIKFKAAYLVT